MALRLPFKGPGPVIAGVFTGGVGGTVSEVGASSGGFTPPVSFPAVLVVSVLGPAGSSWPTPLLPKPGNGVVFSSPFRHPTTLSERTTATADSLITDLSFMIL